MVAEVGALCARVSWRLFALTLIGLLASAGPARSENTRDWITGLALSPIHVASWPGGKKVAVCFVLYVEVWDHGHGPKATNRSVRA
jgi:allantoinase